jgi:hypothetical protein
MEKKIIFIFIFALLLGSFFGYIVGYTMGVKDCVDIAVIMLKTKKIDMDVDKGFITSALILYNQKVKTMVGQNASIFIR